MIGHLLSFTDANEMKRAHAAHPNLICGSPYLPALELKHHYASPQHLEVLEEIGYVGWQRNALALFHGRPESVIQSPMNYNCLMAAIQGGNYECFQIALENLVSEMEELEYFVATDSMSTNIMFNELMESGVEVPDEVLHCFANLFIGSMRSFTYFISLMKQPRCFMLLRYTALPQRLAEYVVDLKGTFAVPYVDIPMSCAWSHAVYNVPSVIPMLELVVGSRGLNPKVDQLTDITCINHPELCRELIDLGYIFSGDAEAPDDVCQALLGITGPSTRSVVAAFFKELIRYRMTFDVTGAINILNNLMHQKQMLYGGILEFSPEIAERHIRPNYEFSQLPAIANADTLRLAPEQLEYYMY